MTQANETASPVANTDFDIGTLDANVNATFQVSVIDDAEGNPKSGFIVVGKNSDAYKAAAHKIRVEGLVRASKRKTAVDTASMEGAETMANAIETNDRVLACAVVVGWFGFAKGGVAAEYDAATAKQMMIKMPTWRQKVLAALEDDANFIKG